jgi:aspartate beta-hydroxylase
MNAATASLARARDCLRQGHIGEAEKLFAEVLSAAPENVEALNVMGLAALREGALPRAVELLSKAVRLQPDLHASRLYLATALDRSGDVHAALFQYARTLSEVQKQNRWVDASSTPPPLRPLVERAAAVIRAGRRAALDRVIDPLVRRYGRGELARVEQCARIYLREEPLVLPDPRQRPSFLFFPGLGASPYLPRPAFEWIPQMEASYAGIRAELLTLLQEDAGRERVFDSETLERTNLRGGLDAPPSWTGFYFYRHGEKREDNCAACPRTAEALARVPLVHVRDHGPEVLFSVFTPGTHLLPHRGVTNTRLVAHLPLIIPQDCALRVGEELHQWVPGQVVVFDDTYEHEAWNRSAQTRVVMIFDVWHPGLTEIERAAITDLVAIIGDFRKATEAA